MHFVASVRPFVRVWICFLSVLDIRGPALPSAAKSNNPNLGQGRVITSLRCLSVCLLSVARMRSIGF